MTDLLVIHPNGRSAYQGLSHELTAIETPVWAGILADYASKGNLNVELIDAEAENHSVDQLGSRAASFSPHLAAIIAYGHQPSASTQMMPAVADAVRAVRAFSPKTKILIVGGHAAALPVRTLIEENADYVCAGEGFETVRRLAAQEPLEDVPDLLWRKGEHVERSGASMNLDEKALADVRVAYQKMPMRLYRAHNWHALGTDRTPYASLYTSLGCPFRCSFCCIQAPFRSADGAVNSYRRWPVAAVVEELYRLRVAYGVRNIKIADEMFVLNEKHVTGICDGILKAGMNDLNLWAYARVDTVKPGLEKKLTAAGFKWLAFGIESAESSVRDGALKTFTDEKVGETVERVRKAGISVIANYIFGLPGEDISSMHKTLALAKRLDTEFANFYTAMAYPGSALFAQTPGKHLPTSWAGYSQHSPEARPLPTKTLTSQQIINFRDFAFVEYHSRPSYLVAIEKKFGSRARHEMEMMLAVKLKRSSV